MATLEGTRFTGHIEQMLKTHPSRATGFEAKAVMACIQACFDCAQTCVACADACLAEEKVESLRRCIRLNQDCADICDVTGRALTRQTAFDPNVARAFLQACMVACRACAEECDKHASMHAHCKACAEACRKCEVACADLLKVS